LLPNCAANIGFVNAFLDGTIAPTLSPSTPAPTTANPTAAPTNPPTSSEPSHAPTLRPSGSPSSFPTQQPSQAPTAGPTSSQPSYNPTVEPSYSPTCSSTSSPTQHACDDGSHACDRTEFGTCTALISPSSGYRCGCTTTHRCSDGDCNTRGHTCVPITGDPTQSPTTVPPTTVPQSSSEGEDSSNPSLEMIVGFAVLGTIIAVLVASVVMLLWERSASTRRTVFQNPAYQGRTPTYASLDDPSTNTIA
jgi:hypothetical protein